MTIPADFKGAARPLGDKDIAWAAHELGCGEDAVHAVLDVEARGCDFDDEGRPAMLFEPHIFYRLTGGAVRRHAVAAGVAYERWGEKPYPRDSYPRLAIAMRLSPEDALRSASWGLSQILGDNFKEAGYSNVSDFVAGACDGEPVQLLQMVNVIKHRGLDHVLRKEDWAAFARSWNGAGYKRNSYDDRLRARYAWWAQKPDTPWDPEYAILETIESDAHAPHVVFPPTARVA